MGHFAIWLEKYNSCRDGILEDLSAYKKQIDEIRDRISKEEIILPLPDSGKKYSGRMCFVDGGEGLRELMGAAIYFIKASALLLDKKGPRYINEKFTRDIDINVLDYDGHVKDRVELLRGAMEFDVAMKCIEENKPEYVFLDGSLYVNSRIKPIECDEHTIYRKKFVRLLKLCKKKDIHLVGVSEDSKSKLLTNYVGMRCNLKFPKFMTDSSILRMLAGNTRYRTIEFIPQSRFESNGRLSSNLIASFPTAYIQPTPLSNPLRVDVPDWEHEFDKIIDVIIDLSKGSRHYGYPLPLYMVHLDAKVESKQADWSTKQLIHHISSGDPTLRETILNKKRRDLRPKL